MNTVSLLKMSKLNQKCCFFFKCMNTVIDESDFNYILSVFKKLQQFLSDPIITTDSFDGIGT